MLSSLSLNKMSCHWSSCPIVTPCITSDERETAGHGITEHLCVPGMVLGAEAMVVRKRWLLSSPRSHSCEKTRKEPDVAARHDVGVPYTSVEATGIRRLGTGLPGGSGISSET